MSGRDVRAVRRALDRAHGGGPPRSVDPQVLWMRARQIRRLRTEERISRILTWGQLLSGAVVLAVVGSVLWWAWAWIPIDEMPDTTWMYVGAAALFAMIPGVARWVSRDPSA